MGKIWKSVFLLLVCLLLGAACRKVWEIRVHTQDLTRQAEELETAMASLGREEAELQRNLAKWYNYHLEQGTEGMGAAYESVRNFGQGQMAVRGVPEWSRKVPVYHGDKGVVGHDSSTALPLGGRGKHTVLLVSETFPWEEGVSLYIDCLGQRLTYRVESVQVMAGHWSTEWPGAGEQDLLTLVYDRARTRTLIRCIRSGELVIRERESLYVPAILLPAAAAPGLLLTWLGWRKWFANHGQKRRSCGFYCKNRRKAKVL